MLFLCLKSHSYESVSSNCSFIFVSGNMTMTGGSPALWKAVASHSLEQNI